GVKRVHGDPVGANDKKALAVDVKAKLAAALDVRDAGAPQFHRAKAGAVPLGVDHLVAFAKFDGDVVQVGLAHGPGPPQPAVVHVSFQHPGRVPHIVAGFEAAALALAPKPDPVSFETVLRKGEVVKKSDARSLG